MQMLLLLLITLWTNWEEEVNQPKLLGMHNQNSSLPCATHCFVGFSISRILNVWPIIFHCASVGFEGKGQSFQFFPASRYDDMKNARCILDRTRCKERYGTHEEFFTEKTASPRCHQHGTSFRDVSRRMICFGDFLSLAWDEMF